MTTKNLLPLLCTLSMTHAACGLDFSNECSTGDPKCESSTGNDRTECTGNESKCENNAFYTCVNGKYEKQKDCPYCCDNFKGCIGECIPNDKTCTIETGIGHMKGYYSNSCSEACTWNHKLTYPCDYGCNPNGECRSSYGCKENDEICVLGTRFICDAASVWMRRNNDCVDSDENPISDNSNPDENKCNDSETMCQNNVFYKCSPDKNYEFKENCTEFERNCDDKLGCIECTPGEKKCISASSQYSDYKYVYKECDSNGFWKMEALALCSDACDDETGCPDSTPGDFNSKCSEETLISCDECTPVCENGTDYYYCNKKIGIMVHEKCSSCAVDSNGIGSKNNCTQKGLTCNNSNSKYVCYNNNLYYCKEGQVDIINCPGCTNGVHEKSDILNCINN